ncbi:YqcI/YcgG family protein [Thioclava sp. FTW29]|uniref:YqcI/YcgG family protein n=1 Tax=Thioclava litoralis TaxID=3076557 RepID=A0ABZ1E684_9RHOB|nr:YqcI/YcgG family protein [Thioclava sp. FTW29]
MDLVFKSSEVTEAFSGQSWEKTVFCEFDTALTSKSRPFPCVFGVAGFKADRLRFAFPDPLTPETLAPILKSYLAQARGIGPMTSLVIFARPGPVQSFDRYREQFWDLLDGLVALDDSPQPDGVSRNLDDPTWEFSFGGEPIFVVCNTPAHVMRQSRRASSFMITFQPRWVFNGITDSDEPGVQRSLKRVRDLLEDYDLIAPSPSLGHYGDPANREYTQYFIDDTNETPACPFHRLGEARLQLVKEG